VAVSLSAEIEERTGYETRYTILGHIQRGGTPTAFDRVLATRFGVAAMDAVLAGRFGEMVALQADQIVLLPLGEATRAHKLLDPRLFEIASVFFG
jgi:6-phosphofructokinase 1